MKRSLALLLMLGLVAICSLQAAPTIISSGSGTGVHTGVDVDTTPIALPGDPGGTANFLVGINKPSSSGWDHPLGTSQWITFDINGDGTPTKSSGQANCGAGSTICNNDFVNFYEDFTASANSTGILQVMADDTAAVWVNGNKVFAENDPYSTGGNTYNTCSNVAIGCLNSGTVGTVNLAGLLVDGTNRIVFQVFQRNGTGYGVDYYAEVVPRPGFYGVLALGLSGLCFAIRRKRTA